MKNPGDRDQLFALIYLAAGSILVGIVLTVVLLIICSNLGIDVTQNVWLLTIPAVLSLLLNIAGIELYERFRKK